LPEFVKTIAEELAGYDEPYPPAFFHFVRKLRSYWPEGAIEADDAFDKVEPIIRKLGCGWPEGAGNSELEGEEAYAEFVTTWVKVRYRCDETPLTQAAAKAKAYPLGTTRSTDKRPLHGYNRFVSLAAWLQVTMGDNPIMLPCRNCAEVLKTVPKMISHWRHWAIEDEFLKVIREHRFHPHGRSEATIFRFDTSRWACLSKIAQQGSKAAFDDAEFIPDERPRA